MSSSSSSSSSATNANAAPTPAQQHANRMKLLMDELYTRVRIREIKYTSQHKMELAKIMATQLSPALPKFSNKILQDNFVLLAKNLAVECNNLQEAFIASEGAASAGPIDEHTVKMAIRLAFPNRNCQSDIFAYIDAALEVYDRQEKQHQQK